MLEIDWHWWIERFSPEWWTERLIDPQFYVRQAAGFFQNNLLFPLFYIVVAIAIQLFFLFKYLRSNKPTESSTWNQLLTFQGIKSGAKSVCRYIAPPEVISKKSFRVDVQFWMLGVLGILSLVAKGLAFIFLLDQVPILFAALGLDDIFFVKIIRSSLNSLDPPQKTLVVFLVAYFSYDFASYWAHRLFHTKFFWEFHKIHHYPAQLNVLAGHRFHPIEPLIQQPIMGIITALAITLVAPLDKSNFYSSYSPYVDSQAWWYASFVFYSSFFGRLVHSHFPIYFGKFFGKILVSPAFHMIHHSKIIIDRNFGGTFAIWDYLFGTHHDVTSLQDYDYHVKNLGVRDMPDEVYKNVIEAIYKPMIDAWRVLFPPRQHPSTAETPDTTPEITK